MRIFTSVSDTPIRLTEERWGHIARRHPEMSETVEMVADTLTRPDLIQEGDSSELLAIRHFPRTPLTSKHLVVVYRETVGTDGFIITAYLTSRPSATRKIVWKR